MQDASKASLLQGIIPLRCYLPRAARVTIVHLYHFIEIEWRPYSEDANGCTRARQGLTIVRRRNAPGCPGNHRFLVLQVSGSQQRAAGALGLVLWFVTRRHRPLCCEPADSYCSRMRFSICRISSVGSEWLRSARRGRWVRSAATTGPDHSRSRKSPGPRESL